MAGLRENALHEAVIRFCERERPLLGICLGMQMLATESEEFGLHMGLGLVSGRVVALPSEGSNGERIKVPQVGWSALSVPQDSDWSGSILRRTEPGTAMYCVHSFHFVPDKSTDVLASFDYCGNRIVAALRSGAISGCQFHPEKSGIAGLSILGSFLSE
jgi:glutamine amidotransferase